MISLTIWRDYEYNSYFHDFVLLSECVWSARCGIRTKEWKFIKTIDKGCFDKPDRELYNLGLDPKELDNLAEKEKDILKELEYKMDREIERCLGNRPNPLRIEAASGLPGKRWVERTLKQMGMSIEEFRNRQKYI